MGNVENKRRNPGSNSRRAVVGRVFNRILPGSRISGRVVDDHGNLAPSTEHDGECPVCFQPAEVLLQFSTCSHMACTACWLTFMCTEINSFAMSRLTCIGCREPLSASTVVNMLTAAVKDPSSYGLSTSLTIGSLNCSQMLSRYEEFLLRRSLAREPDIRWCPSGCGYGLIAHGFKQCPQITCPRPECGGRSFCYNCQRPWFTEDEISRPSNASSPALPTHVCAEQTIDIDGRSDAVEGIFAFLGIGQLRRISSTPLDRGSSHPPGPSPSVLHRSLATPLEEKHENSTEAIPFVDDTDIHDIITPHDLEAGVRRSSTCSEKSSSSEIGEVKPCPNCTIPIQKLNDGSCNSMVCSVCGYDFCWLCLQPVRFGHYFSLSGCTVWGKHKWSPRRRVYILLVILFGTPVFLPVSVALSIPLGTLGLIFLGFSATNCALKHVNKHVRRFSLFCVSLIGLIVAPVLCGLLITLLIPVALSYAYIYLPVSVLSSIYKRPHSQLSSNDSPSIS